MARTLCSADQLLTLLYFPADDRGDISAAGRGRSAGQVLPATRGGTRALHADGRQVRPIVRKLRHIQAAGTE